jgi:hypothetical protein
MIRILGIVFSAAELVGFIAMAFLAHATRQRFSWFVVCCVIAAISAFGFMLRLRERSLSQDIADAEDKLVKRVLRRVTKVDGAELAKLLLPFVEAHIEVVAERREKAIMAALAPSIEGAFDRLFEKSMEYAQRAAPSAVQRLVQMKTDETQNKA